MDVNAGYHERRTRWRWAVGAGRDQHDRLVAFSAITGLHDGPVHSVRTIWMDGEVCGRSARALSLTTSRPS